MGSGARPLPPRRIGHSLRPGRAGPTAPRRASPRRFSSLCASPAAQPVLSLLCASHTPRLRRPLPQRLSASERRAAPLASRSPRSPATGKPRGVNAARKLRTVRRTQRWAQKRYKKAHLGTQFKCNPFGGSSHCKGIVLEKMCAATVRCRELSSLTRPRPPPWQWHRGQAAQLRYPEVRARPVDQKRQEDRRLRAA